MPDPFCQFFVLSSLCVHHSSGLLVDLAPITLQLILLPPACPLQFVFWTGHWIRPDHVLSSPTAGLMVCLFGLGFDHRTPWKSMASLPRKIHVYTHIQCYVFPNQVLNVIFWVFQLSGFASLICLFTFLQNWDWIQGLTYAKQMLYHRTISQAEFLSL